MGQNLFEKMKQLFPLIPCSIMIIGVLFTQNDLKDLVS